MWCIPNVTDDFKQKMLDVLGVYERPYDAKYPVVCIDEKSKQLLKEIRKPHLQNVGKPYRGDYEYVRNGTCNLFVAVEPKGKKRIVRVTKRRTIDDYASFMKYLVKTVYKGVTKIILVTDNLNTHTEAALLRGLGKRQGERIAKKIEWHYTPKHASWLNQAEIEIHSLEQQCLHRRIPDFHTMQSEVAACVRKRNEDQCGINWQFTREKAKEKFSIS